MNSRRLILSSTLVLFSLTGATIAHAQDLRLKVGKVDASNASEVAGLREKIQHAAGAYCSAQIETGTRLHDSSCTANASQAIIQSLPHDLQAALRSGGSIASAGSNITVR